jgi:hypothetical protein
LPGERKRADPLLDARTPGGHALGIGEDASAAAVLEEALAVPTSPKDGTSTIEKQRALMLTRLARADADAVAAATRSR